MHVGVTVLPSQFPHHLFQQAKDVQGAMSLLYFRVSRDFKFLSSALAEVAKIDYNIKQTLELLGQINAEEPSRQPISLLIQETTYLCHREGDNYELKQIGVQNGSAHVQMGERVTDLHRRSITEIGMDAAPDTVPNNRATNAVAVALYRAWQSFGSTKAIILIVDDNRGSGILRHVYIAEQMARISGGKAKITRIEKAEVMKHLTLDRTSFDLLYDRHDTVAVFYQPMIQYRHFDQSQLRIHRVVERSTAIICPTIGMVLASNRKVQQVLSEPDMVERFFPDPNYAQMISDIRRTFTRYWALDQQGEEIDKMIKDAIQHPNQYILQSNSGTFGRQEYMVEYLRKLNSKLRKNIWLMGPLNRMVNKNFVAMDAHHRTYHYEKPILVESELSTLGFLLVNTAESTVPYQAAHGHVLLTKRQWDPEGHIFDVYDSPYLI